MGKIAFIQIGKRPQQTIWFACGFLFVLIVLWWNLLPTPLFDKPYATVLLDRKGEIIDMQVAADGQMRFEDMHELPERYVLSLLMFEDKNFIYHRGVDWWAIVRALVANIKNGRIVSGGSTLSMQVVRLFRDNPPRTIWEKIKELVLTIRLEQSYSKKEILELYATHAPFGGNVVGLQAASLKYFNRSPKELSWAEAALLAVLPNAPSLIYPGKNNLQLKNKRDRLLARMHKYGIISDDSYELALKESLPAHLFERPSLAPHLLARAQKEKGGTVVSYIDGILQRQVNDIVERHAAMLSQNYVYNVAVLVAHIPTGEVRAYVGNSKARVGSRGNDVDIIQANRSSGSIFKPILYAMMLQSGFILPDMLVADIPSRFGGYAPSNFSKDFKGAVPASQALAQSLNIPFVRLLRDYTYVRFYDDLKELGLNSLTRPADHYGLSLILGGAETSLWDMCNLYGGMASVLNHYGDEDGQYYDGEFSRLKLWQKRDSLRCKQKSQPSGILQAAAIWQTFRAMEQVERPEMESGWKHFVSALNLSWKTGTSFGFRDAWAIGVNPDYVVGVWVGNADGEGRPGLTGVRAAAPILFEVAGLLPCRRRFYEPREEMSLTAVCRKSGCRPSVFCEELDSIYVCENGMRTGLCPYHQIINLDSTETWRVTSDCESVYSMKRKSWFVLPPVQEWYYCRTHSDYKKLPPYRPGCNPGNEDVMEMIYPQPGVRVFIPRDFGAKPGNVVFEAVHRSADAKIYWYIDDKYMGMTQNRHQMEFWLQEGSYRLTLTDQDGCELKQVFRVVGKDIL